MPIFIVTGKLGGGKTLVTVARMKEYLERGAPVATNLDIRLDRMFHKDAKNLNVVRLPDKPTVDDLRSIGKGNTSYDESKNGMLALDECGTWFNSRNWNDKARKEVNEWFLHARKLGWDVFLIVQDISILDSQARVAIAEHTVFCSRLDRIAIPFLGAFISMITGSRLKGPRIHSARVVYGQSRTDLLSDRWVYRGTGLFRAYDTKQLFLEDYPHGSHCQLTPWHLLGRYRKPWTTERIMRLTQIYWKKLKAPLALGAGALVGVLVGMLLWPYMQVSMQAKAAMVNDLVPVAPVDIEAAAVEPVPDTMSAIGPSDEPFTVEQTFAGFVISAHVRNQHSQYYLVSNQDGSQYTDAQLRSMGFRVYFVNECELLIVSAESMNDKHAVFAPGCTPRRAGAEQVDLTQVPGMQPFGRGVFGNGSRVQLKPRHTSALSTPAQQSTSPSL